MKRNILMMLALLSMTSVAFGANDTAGAAAPKGDGFFTKQIKRAKDYFTAGDYTPKAFDAAAYEGDLGDDYEQVDAAVDGKAAVGAEGDASYIAATPAKKATRRKKGDANPWYATKKATQIRRGADASLMALGTGAIAADLYTGTVSNYLAGKWSFFSKLPKWAQRSLVAVVEGLFLEVVMSLVGGRYNEGDYSLIGQSRRGVTAAKGYFAKEKGKGDNPAGNGTGAKQS